MGIIRFRLKNGLDIKLDTILSLLPTRQCNQISLIVSFSCYFKRIASALFAANFVLFPRSRKPSKKQRIIHFLICIDKNNLS